MANPNIVNVSDIRGKTHLSSLNSGSYGTLVTNPSNSGSIYKINVASVSNNSGGTRNITLGITRSGTTFDVANNVSVPNQSTLVISSKDTSFYMEEGDVLVGFANSSGTEILVSYEIIS